MKEPFFIYTKATQTIAIAHDKHLPVKLFLERVPTFKPPPCDMLIYEPGVRLFISKDGTQAPLPQFDQRSDVVTWEEGDKWIAEAGEAYRLMKQRQAVPPVFSEMERA